jgi:hypothetical protein
MNAGQYISGAGHLGLIGWLLLGGVFAAEPKPVEMTEVAVISGADFDAMVAAAAAPDQVTEVAQPSAPEILPDTPEVVTQPDVAIQQPPPLRTETPTSDTPPDVTELALPPETEVDDTPPVLEDPIGDVAVLVPEVAPQAVARPVDRVAPEPVALPNPDAIPDVAQQDAVSPDATGDPVDQESQTATAPEEATTEIVTEATTAPKSSVRPPGRRPAAPQATQTAQEQPQTDDVDAAAIAAAVAAAQTEAPTPIAPTGPPLSAGEKESLRVAVSSCWNVGSLSSEALQTTVTVSVAMNTDGTPIVGSINLDSSTGGSSAAARQAFEAARRAIIRCGSRGFKLPAEKFGQWQNIEMTFNPERMRVK